MINYILKFLKSQLKIQKIYILILTIQNKCYIIYLFQEYCILGGDYIACISKGETISGRPWNHTSICCGKVWNFTGDIQRNYARSTQTLC